MNRIGKFKPHWLLTTHDMDLYLQDCSFFLYISCSISICENWRASREFDVWNMT